MNSEILGLIGERRKAKADDQKYKELDKQIKKRCNETKENRINTQCEEIEGNNRIDIKTMHQKIRDATRKKIVSRSRVSAIKRWKHSHGKGRHPQQMVRIHHRTVP